MENGRKTPPVRVTEENVGATFGASEREHTRAPNKERKREREREKERCERMHWVCYRLEIFMDR